MGEVRLYCATLQQGLAQAIKRLQRKGNQVLVRFAGALCSLGFGEVAGYGFQGVGIRQGGQQGPLFSRQSETANQFTKSPQHGSQCQDNVPRQGNVLDGLAQPIRTEENPVVRFTRINGRRDNSASIELSKRPAQELEGLGIKTEKVRVYANRPFTRWLTNASSKIQRGNYCEEAGNSGEELTPEERFVLVNGGRDNSSHKEANRVQAEALVKLGLQVKKCKVYDILNAGPRRRFTCNGKLVSNCFGMSVDGFIEYARTSYGVALTYEQAEKIRNTFFESYPQLLVYHRVYKAYAHKHEQVVSPLGRIRHLPLINSKLREVQAKEERRSINSPVQSTLTDMMIWSIALQHQRGWLEKTPVFGVIHDAQYLYVPQDNHEHYIKRSKEVMENLPFEQLGWAPQLKFTADAKFGTSMGDLS